MLRPEEVTRPTLLLNRQQAINNIERMHRKAAQSSVAFRPHFKTHQSATIGSWFRKMGVTAITVSSVEMAVYFAQHGWQDITIAFPVNVRQLDAINALADSLTLHLLLDNANTAVQLNQALTHSVNVWLEVDAGYHRTGVPWDNTQTILTVARTVQQAQHLQWRGILTHAGNTYAARGQAAILAAHAETMSRLHTVQTRLVENGMETAVSIGDTPACSVLESFTGVDEIRPGNFVFYDLMQAQIGACTLPEIAVAAACPVVGVYPQRNQIALYGGAVHLSKESLVEADGSIRYGRIARLTQDGWEILSPHHYVAGLSQEHGLVQTNEDLLNTVTPGDLLLVLPVHSCLTANLLKKYVTLEGEQIHMAAIH